MVRRRQVRASHGIARLGVLAVLLQILLPAFHHPAAATPYARFADSVLCSSTGGTIDRAGLPNENPGKSCPRCPICWGLQQLAGGFTVPGAVIAPQLALGGDLANPLSKGTASPTSVPMQAAQPRGPPVLA